MRTVNVAELKNRLSTYLTFAKSGEEIIIRERNLPVAKLVRFAAEDASDDDLTLVAAGMMRMPATPFDLEMFDAMPMPGVSGRRAVEAVLEERDASS